MSFVEPERSKFPYAGWIPTVNGNLSFRHVGEARYPTESIYANVTTNHRRVIIAYQRRSLSDVFFQTIIHYLCNIEGSFWFVLTAHSIGPPGNTIEVVGIIYIYKSKVDWREKGEQSVRDAIYDLNEIQISLDPKRNEKIDNYYTDSIGNLKKTADIEIDFHLFRSGEVYFSKPKFQDPELEYASVDYAKECGHDFPRWVADQTYFFLRDLTHKHQHHSPSSDTILILQERSDDQLGWRKNIIYSLHFFIIRLKRFADVRSLFQAAGVLAYCMSFKAICERHMGPRALDIPVFNDAALMQSITARSQEEAAEASQWVALSAIRVARAGTNRALMLMFVTIVVTILAMLIQPLVEVRKAPWLTAASELAAENFPSILFTLGILWGTVWLLTSDWHAKKPIGIDILEFSNVKRIRSVFIYVFSALLVLAVSIRFSEPAVQQIIGTAKEFFVILFK